MLPKIILVISKLLHILDHWNNFFSRQVRTILVTKYHCLIFTGIKCGSQLLKENCNLSLQQYPFGKSVNEPLRLKYLPKLCITYILKDMYLHIFFSDIDKLFCKTIQLQQHVFISKVHGLFTKSFIFCISTVCIKKRRFYKVAWIGSHHLQ